MKKVLLAILVFASLHSMAQGVSGGIKAGANISNFSGGNFDAVKKKALVGFHAGGYLNFALGAVSLQPEALVSTNGARIDDGTGYKDYRLTYISVPVMLKYKTMGGFYLEAGPQVGFKINDDIPDQTIGDFAKGLDLSVGAGLGFQAGRGFGIGARYIAGLSKVGDYEAGSFDPDFKNGIVQVGFFFRLGK